MTFQIHNQRYEGSIHLHKPLEWLDMRIEHRRLTPSTVRPVTFTCVCVNLALAGQTPAWRSAGHTILRNVIRPGMASIDPPGLDETQTEMSAAIETLHIYLAPSVIGHSALADYDIDPATAQLAYAGGLRDPLLKEVGCALLQIISRPPQPADRLFIEGARSMLAAHLVSNYRSARWHRAARQPGIPDIKMKRVIDLIESRFAQEISLSDLAAAACLSQFHFTRLFRRVTGLSPHQYVTERRIQDAKTKLAEGRLPLVEVALEAGFGSQGNFNRTFRKHTGLTPGEFRTQQRGRSAQTQPPAWAGQPVCPLRREC